MWVSFFLYKEGFLYLYFTEISICTRFCGPQTTTPQKTIFVCILFTSFVLWFGDDDAAADGADVDADDKLQLVVKIVKRGTISLLS